MSDRLSYYFRERVTDAELNLGFDELEKADQTQAADLGFTGVLANMVVSQHAPVADLTVDVSGPDAALDPLGQRIFFSALQTVNVAQDDNAVATAVSAAGKEKIVSIFVAFDRTLSDPRIDGNSQTVFFRRDESFKFRVVQGAEAAAGAAVPPPRQPDALLLADVTRSFGQAQLLAAAISIARRQDAFVLTSAPRSIRRGRTIEALGDLLTYFNAHALGTSDRHGATALDYAGGGAWADGTQNPATTVGAQLEKLVADLAAASGAPKIGAAATAGAPFALAAGSVKAQLDALLAALNANAASLAAPAGAAAIGAVASPGAPTALAAGTVRSQLDALLGALNAHVARAAGAHASSAIAYAGGGAWADASANPASTVDAQLTKLVADLAAAAGAARIGAAASGNLPAGTVRSQLDALDATAVRTTVPNAFTAAQTVNGAAGDTNAALLTTTAPVVRKLLWELATTAAYKARFYTSVNLNGALEITVNARWDGGQWVCDMPVLTAVKWTFANWEWRIDVKTGSPTFTDAQWAGSFSIAFPVGVPRNISIDVNGEVNTLGPLTGYSGVAGTWADGTIGAAGSFASGRLPAAPSSVTFTVSASMGMVAMTPLLHTTDRTGVGWLALTTNDRQTNERQMFVAFTAT